VRGRRGTVPPPGGCALDGADARAQGQPDVGFI
jgi:hypothetical protein